MSMSSINGRYHINKLRNFMKKNSLSTKCVNSFRITSTRQELRVTDSTAMTRYQALSCIKQAFISISSCTSLCSRPAWIVSSGMVWLTVSKQAELRLETNETTVRSLLDKREECVLCASERSKGKERGRRKGNWKLWQKRKHSKISL